VATLSNLPRIASGIPGLLPPATSPQILDKMGAPNLELAKGPPNQRTNRN
jgi:hypothetical protein